MWPTHTSRAPRLISLNQCVIAGLVSAIHAVRQGKTAESDLAQFRGGNRAEVFHCYSLTAWMAGTSPAMTVNGFWLALAFPDELAPLMVRAFPPVAVLLVNAAPALQPRADLIALLARLRRLGVVAVGALALRIRGEPRCQHWRLRVGRGGKSGDDRGRSERERDGRDHPPPARRVRARGSQRIFGCPHAPRIWAAGSRRKRLRISLPIILARSARVVLGRSLAGVLLATAIF
jgi:hypothetical protein